MFFFFLREDFSLWAWRLVERGRIGGLSEFGSGEGREGGDDRRISFLSFEGTIFVQLENLS